MILIRLAPNTRKSNPRVHRDQTDREFLSKVATDAAFDVVVDDGGTSPDNSGSRSRLYGHTCAARCYCVED